MPLAEPPSGAGSLSGVPAQPTRGRTLHRVWRHQLADGGVRADPWWFGSAPPDPTAGPAAGGRYDLPAPMGTCYTATRPVGAMLEALGAHLVNLPSVELLVRRRAEVTAPDDAPPAARLTARSLVGRLGVTAALWAGADRSLTQRWAAAFRRDGWWALYGGLAHDPSGRLRGYALFDAQGAHAPTLGSGWRHRTATLHDDEDLHAELARYGVTVREPGTLPYAPAPDEAAG